jgi:hypothetical protein
MSAHDAVMDATRVGHWRRDRAACEVYVGRGSPWGNPYTWEGGAARSRYPVIEVADPLAAYEAHVRATPALMAALPELRGKVLGCYCVRLGTKSRVERCHGHVLARMADGVPAEPQAATMNQDGG